MKKIYNKSRDLRILLAFMLAITVIIADKKICIFFTIRTYIDMTISKIYFLEKSNINIFDNISKIIFIRNKIIFENNNLRNELLIQKSEQLLLGKYKNENTKLYELLCFPLRYGDNNKIITKIIYTNTYPYSNQIIIDKGIKSGVYVGQPVISYKGVVGQVIATNKLTSRVLLISDFYHALSIQVLRNDIRIIITGNGCKEYLHIKNLNNHIDLYVGDLFVTSGIGCFFPEGYPVAVVSSVTVDTKNYFNTIIKARPIASLYNLYYLLLLV